MSSSVLVREVCGAEGMQRTKVGMRATGSQARDSRSPEPEEAKGPSLQPLVESVALPFLLDLGSPRVQVSVFQAPTTPKSGVICLAAPRAGPASPPAPLHPRPGAHTKGQTVTDQPLTAGSGKASRGHFTLAVPLRAGQGRQQLKVGCFDPRNLRKGCWSTWKAGLRPRARVDKASWVMVSSSWPRGQVTASDPRGQESKFGMHVFRGVPEEGAGRTMGTAGRRAGHQRAVPTPLQLRNCFP
jgi:hypothetical protein